MSAPAVSAALQQFVEEELLRAPLVMETAAKSIFTSLQRLPPGVSGAERQTVGDLLLRLGSQRSRVVDAYVASLRRQVQDELAGVTPEPSSAGAAGKPKPKAASALSLAPTTGTLSLVGDDEVSVDVGIASVIESIRGVAEHELREMLAYTSALVGDMHVTADHNPFRAETQARALWDAAQALQLSQTHAMAFLRYAATPFAQALLSAYSAACGRLEEQGIEPAAYRTLIMPLGPRSTRAMPGSTMTVDTLAYAANPASLPLHLTPSAAPAVAPPPPMAAPAPVPGAERLSPSLIDAIGRVFGAILADRRLPHELHPLVSRMQALAVQAAALDPALLDHPQHGLWRFMDQCVHLGVLDEGPEGEARRSLIRFAERLVDQIAGETRHTPQLYLWAVERIEFHATRRLAERLTRVEGQIAELARLESRLTASEPGSQSLSGMIDAAHLDTVPADLLEAQSIAQRSRPPHDPDSWLMDRRPGEWLRMVVGGRWIWSQLLWVGERGEIWLFGNTDADEGWAMRRGALRKLHEAGLADVMQPRSLVRAAVARLVRGEPRDSR